MALRPPTAPHARSTLQHPSHVLRVNIYNIHKEEVLMRLKKTLNSHRSLRVTLRSPG